LPIVTLTQRHDLAMVMPFERTPGNRARDAQTTPNDTVHGTLDRALVVANRARNVPKVAGEEPGPPVLTGGTLGIVELQRHGGVRDAETDPAGTMRAGGFHHAIVMRNNTARGDQGQMSTPDHEPFRTLTSSCTQALVVPYGSEMHDPLEPAKTITTRDRLALIVPPMGGIELRDADTEPGPTQTTTTRAGLVTKEAA
jgi:DNA (cytosine-5)-methyltransferase 1